MVSSPSSCSQALLDSTTDSSRLQAAVTPCAHVRLAVACCSYNLRVVECRLAAACLALALGASASQAREIKTLREVEPRIVDK